MKYLQKKLYHQLKIKHAQIDFNNFDIFIMISSSYVYQDRIGGGVIAATLGIIIAIFGALFGLLWFPIKNILKKRKEKKENNQKKID